MRLGNKRLINLVFASDHITYILASNEDDLQRKWRNWVNMTSV
jgi:hypothetical protein